MLVDGDSFDLLSNHPFFYDNKPKEPAVTPIVTKKQNSNKSLEPGGIELIIVEIKIMSIHIALRQEQHNQL